MLAELSKAEIRRFREASSLLSKVKLEMNIESVGYYTMDRLAEVYRRAPLSPSRLAEALSGEGYKAYPTHFNPQGVRTEAPISIVKKIFLQELKH